MGILDSGWFKWYNFDTYSAVKTLGVVVVVQSFHPSVSGFYWESTGYTLGGEQFIPV